MMLQTSTNRRFAHTLCSHTLSVPWDRAHPERGTLNIFAREIIPDGGEQWPMIVYLQGGPGFPAPRFTGPTGWLRTLLQHYRVLLLDQRGTGNSANALIDAAEGSGEHFSLLRANNIVEDCEDFRKALGIDRWSLMGQSFGGFCITTYLSLYPNSIQHAYITGGLPATTCHIDDVYQATYTLTRRRNEQFYAQFPWADSRVREICHHLERSQEVLPTGERLSARRFRTIGIGLGRGIGFDDLGYLLENPFTQHNGEKRLRASVLAQIGQRVSFAENPLYAVIHESIYGGTVPGATQWSAHRIREEIPGFALQADPRDLSEPYFLTGEHIYPWMFEEDPALRPYKNIAEFLAEKDDWESLYNHESLSESSAVCAAAVYCDDMFVLMQYSLETAALFSDLRLHITNEYQHDGLRVGGEQILSTLMAKTNEY